MSLCYFAIPGCPVAFRLVARAFTVQAITPIDFFVNTGLDFLKFHQGFSTRRSSIQAFGEFHLIVNNQSHQIHIVGSILLENTETAVLLALNFVNVGTQFSRLGAPFAFSEYGVNLTFDGVPVGPCPASYQHQG